MAIILFEDEQWRNFSTLTDTRPIFDLRCGGYTLRERLAAMGSAGAAAGNGNPDGYRRTTAFAPPLGLCRPHLMGYYGPQGGFGALLGESVPAVLVNGRALDVGWLPQLLEAPLGTVYLAGETLLGARLTPALASAVLYYLREQHTGAALDELRRFARVVDVAEWGEPPVLLSYPWDVILHTANQLVRDIPLLAARLPGYSPTDPHIVVHGAGQVYVARSARLDGPVVLDARDGPIFIDEKAHIEPFSFIQGPTYIGAGTLISSARIRGETSIGPVCRIGGEVEASVVQGFSNKHHDGFLGHSWLGEWVNIGAMTTNSDLKNNYGTIRVNLDGLGQIDSGMIKLGCFLADHVKLGIGVHLNGGTVVGTGSNIFGIHMLPKTIASFTWGGDVFREYRIDNMIKVARTVMGRRKQELVPAYEALLRAVFDMTRASRGDLGGPPLLPGANPPAEAELALAGAEREAIRAFEEVAR